MNWLVAIMGVLAAVGSLAGLGSLFTVRASRRRIVAQADETVAGAARVLIGGAADLIEPLRRQLADASARADRINGQLQIAEERVAKLESQLDRLRIAIHTPTMTLQKLRDILP